MLRVWAWLVLHKRNKNKYNKINNNEQIKNSLVQTMTNIDIIAVVMVLLSLFYGKNESKLNEMMEEVWLAQLKSYVECWCHEILGPLLSWSPPGPILTVN